MSKSTKEEAKKGEGREETWTALHGVCNAVARFPFGAAAMLTGVFVRSQQDDLHKETTVREPARRWGVTAVAFRPAATADRNSQTNGSTCRPQRGGRAAWQKMFNSGLNRQSRHGRRPVVMLGRKGRRKGACVLTLACHEPAEGQLSVPQFLHQ